MDVLKIKANTPSIFVIMGATGDLAKKKIIIAIKVNGKNDNESHIFAVFSILSIFHAPFCWPTNVVVAIESHTPINITIENIWLPTP